MIEYYLLQELCTFAETGTVSQTAKQLNLTQPAVTHSLQKLEKALGVQLFKRTPNHITLTETGKYAAREAKKVLNANQDFIQKVAQFNRNQVVVTLAANAPGPLIIANNLHLKNLQVKQKLVEQHLEVLLAEEQVTCLLLNQEIKDRDISSVYLGTEKMGVNVQKDSPFAKMPELHLKDLAGQTIMSPQHIGFWRQIYEEQIPGVNIIFQSNSADYSTILNHSALLYMTTNLTALAHVWGKNLPQDRVFKPLADPIAHQQFYACFLKKNQQRLTPVIEALQDTWAKFD